jgi:hypothetical protein
MPFENNSEPSLADELLTEVAEGYFGRRRRLDESIAMLHANVEKLKQEEKYVNTRAAYLNYLLLEGRVAEDFYGIIGVEPGAALLDPVPEATLLPEKLPSGLTLKTRYTRLVEQAYEQLRLRSALHMEGPTPEMDAEPPDAEEPIYYALAKAICKMVNDRIEHANRDMSPANMMVYARNFDVNHRRKARITGSVSGDYADRIDRKLEYQPIEFDDFGLQKYPQLPTLPKVQANIKTFCQRLCRKNKNEINAMLCSSRYS